MKGNICLKIDETKSSSLYILQPDRNWIKTFDLELGQEYDRKKNSVKS